MDGVVDFLDGLFIMRSELRMTVGVRVRVRVRNLFILCGECIDVNWFHTCYLFLSLLFLSSRLYFLHTHDAWSTSVYSSQEATKCVLLREYK